MFLSEILQNQELLYLIIELNGTETFPSHMTIPDNGVKFDAGLFVTYTLDVHRSDYVVL